MTALAVMAVLWPLSRQRASRAAREADLAVYRDQLSEIERDVAAGLLSRELAQAARVEVARRMLAVDDAPAGPVPLDPGALRRRRRLVALIAIVVLPGLAASLYLHLGTPELPGAPLAQRLAAPASRGDVAILVRKVEAHLAAHPEDGQGFELLAPVYLRLGRVDDAVGAFAQSIRLLGSSAERQSALGEALVIRDEGLVGEDAARAFKAALEQDPTLPKARYFLGLAAEQDGRPAEAAQIWARLARDATPDAPWLGLVRAGLARVSASISPALKGGQTPSMSPGPGPTAQDVAAAAELSADQRASMVRGMVERLEQRLKTSPQDLDGWLRLARAWNVLGERERVLATLQSARAIFAQDAAAIARIDATRKDLGLDG